MKRKHLWLRDCRGSVSIECAIGAVVMLTASALALDLYRLASTQATVMHSAVTVADSVSRDTELDAMFIDTLAEFLYVDQFDPADAAFVISAFSHETGSTSVLWTKEVFLGTDAATDLADCSQVSEHGSASLPAELAMEDGEVVVVAEVCVERAGEDRIYAHHILPSRADEAGRAGLSGRRSTPCA